MTRYFNHFANQTCAMRKIMAEGEPYLCLFEIRYSYGDPKKVNLWWQNDVRLLFTYYCIKHKFCLHNLFLDNKPPIRSLCYNWTLVSLKWWAKYLISYIDIINNITVYSCIHSEFWYASHILIFLCISFMKSFLRI